MSSAVQEAAAAVAADEEPSSETADSTADPDRDPAEVFAERDRGIPSEEIGSEPQSITGRLMAPMEGSIKQDRVGELWDRDRGGLNRLALVAEETAGLGEGLPRVVHLAIGVAESYLNLAEHADAPSSDGETDEETDEETGEMDETTREVLNV